MKELKGFENAKVYTGESKQLPKGGYVAKIIDCKEVSGEKNGYSFGYLSFAFDIAEGEYKEHYKKIYSEDINEEKKWKGVYNAFIPQEGTQYYEDNLNRFKTMIANIEESNPGYHWDWDEKKLKGKTIGIVFGEKEFRTQQGDVIVITEPRYFINVDAVRSGKFKEPKFKKLENNQGVSFTNDFAEIDDGLDDKLPF